MTVAIQHNLDKANLKMIDISTKLNIQNTRNKYLTLNIKDKYYDKYIQYKSKYMKLKEKLKKL
jgi:hypothetical protein